MLAPLMMWWMYQTPRYVRRSGEWVQVTRFVRIHGEWVVAQPVV